MKEEMSFWDHLEVFRWVIVKSLALVAVASVLFFLKKELLTEILFAPSDSNFILYRGFCWLGEVTGFDTLCFSNFEIVLLNTQLTAMFYTHMMLSFYAGVIVTIPFITVFLWRFIAPALYESERKYGLLLASSCGGLFLLGVLLGYFLIFPLAARFFWTYELSTVIEKKIELSSYLNLFTQTILLVGLVFELPLVSYFFAKMGLLTAKSMKKRRKVAFVMILLAAGFLTPPDPFSMFLVALPMYILYEVSIIIVGRVEKKQSEEETNVIATEKDI